MKLLAISMVLAGAAVAQDTSLKARELFYTPPPDAAPKKPAGKTQAAAKPTQAPSTKSTQEPMTHHSQPMIPAVNAANVPLGLRYSILKRDASGKFAEVDPDTTFRSGDRIRLHVDANTSGYLYVVMQGSSGNWTPLFPASGVDGGNNRIERGSAQQIPSGNTGQFVFDQQSGTEKLFLVLSRNPEPDLDKLIYAITGAKSSDRRMMAEARVPDDVVNRLRDEVKSRDLVFEKVNQDGPDAEKATYVVNPQTTADALLVVDVALKHGK